MIEQFTGHEDVVLDIALSPDGETLYSSSMDATVRIWNVASGELIATLQPFSDDSVNCLALSPDGSKLLVGGWPYSDETPKAPIALLDACTGKTLLILEGHTQSFPTSEQFCLKER